MKNITKVFLSLILFCGIITGCSSKSEADKAYKINLAGTDITVGETKVSELSNSKYILDVEPGQMLEKDSYYHGIAFYDENEEWIGHIDIATEDEDIPLEEGIIAAVRVYGAEDGEEKDLSNITIEGVKLSEMTLDKAKETFTGMESDEDSVWIPNGEYGFRISYNEDGSLDEFSHDKVYDVDWNSN